MDPGYPVRLQQLEGWRGVSPAGGEVTRPEEGHNHHQQHYWELTDTKGLKQKIKITNIIRYI